MTDDDIHSDMSISLASEAGERNGTEKELELAIDISDYTFTRDDVAKRYFVSPQSIGIWVRRREFPNPLVVGRRAYWCEADLRKFDLYLAKKSLENEYGREVQRPDYSLPHSGPIRETAKVSYE